MSVWQTPLGVNVVNNPLVDSPFIAQFNIGSSSPFSKTNELVTEGGAFILIEGGEELTTE